MNERVPATLQLEHSWTYHRLTQREAMAFRFNPETSAVYLLEAEGVKFMLELQYITILTALTRCCSASTVMVPDEGLTPICYSCSTPVVWSKRDSLNTGFYIFQKKRDHPRLALLVPLWLAAAGLDVLAIALMGASLQRDLEELARTLPR